MIKLCVEGWRKINHSYAIVNQKQLIELSKLPIYLRHKDIDFATKDWNELENSNGFSQGENNILDNKVTAGQSVWSLKLSADYALSKSFNAVFFYDHLFSEFAISTAFPQTTIRSGITLRYNFGE